MRVVRYECRPFIVLPQGAGSLGGRRIGSVQLTRDDPTSDPETFTLTKMGIDATKPSGKDFAERLVISDEQRARARSILQTAGVKL